MLSANGGTRHHSVYITIVDEDQGEIRMCSRKQGDTHFCSVGASKPRRLQQTPLQLMRKEPDVSTPEVGEVRGLEKATSTRYGDITAQAGETDTMLETSPEHEAGDFLVVVE